MKHRDEFEYHLSNFHRDHMNESMPDIGVEYRAHHVELKALEQAVLAKKNEIVEFIRIHRLKAKRTPEAEVRYQEHLARNRAHTAAQRAKRESEAQQSPRP